MELQLQLTLEEEARILDPRTQLKLHLSQELPLEPYQLEFGQKQKPFELDPRTQLQVQLARESLQKKQQLQSERESSVNDLFQQIVQENEKEQEAEHVTAKKRHEKQQGLIADAKKQEEQKRQQTKAAGNGISGSPKPAPEPQKPLNFRMYGKFDLEMVLATAWSMLPEERIKVSKLMSIEDPLHGVALELMNMVKTLLSFKVPKKPKLNAIEHNAVLQEVLRLSIWWLGCGTGLPDVILDIVGGILSDGQQFYQDYPTGPTSVKDASENVLQPSYLESNIDYFQSAGGFDFVCHRIETAHSFEQIKKLLLTVCPRFQYMSTELAGKHVESITSRVFQRLEAFNDSRTKAFSSEDCYDLMKSLEALWGANFEDLYKLKLRFLSTMLFCDFLDQKLMAFNLLDRDLESNNCTKPLAGWTSKHAVLARIYQEDTHVEVIRRSKRLLKFTVQHNLVSADMFTTLWRMAFGEDKHFSNAMFESFSQLACLLSLQQQAHMYALLKQVRVASYSPSFLSFIQEFTTNLVSNPVGCDVSSGLNVMWMAFQTGEKNCAVSDQAKLCLAALMNGCCQHYRMKFLPICIENVKQFCNVTLTLLLLVDLFGGIKSDPQPQDAEALVLWNGMRLATLLPKLDLEHKILSNLINEHLNFVDDDVDEVMRMDGVRTRLGFLDFFLTESNLKLNEVSASKLFSLVQQAKSVAERRCRMEWFFSKINLPKGSISLFQGNVCKALFSLARSKSVSAYDWDDFEMFQALFLETNRQSGKVQNVLSTMEFTVVHEKLIGADELWNIVHQTPDDKIMLCGIKLIMTTIKSLGSKLQEKSQDIRMSFVGKCLESAEKGDSPDRSLKLLRSFFVSPVVKDGPLDVQLVLKPNQYKTLLTLLKRTGAVAREAWGVLELLPTPNPDLELLSMIKPHHTLNALYGMRVYSENFQKSQTFWSKPADRLQLLTDLFLHEDSNNADMWMHLMRIRYRSDALRLICREPKLLSAHLSAMDKITRDLLVKRVVHAIAEATLFERTDINLVGCDSALPQACRDMIISAFNLISLLVDVGGQDSILQVMRNVPRITALLVGSVSSCRIVEVREQMCQSLRLLCQNYTSFADWISGLLIEALCNASRTTEYYRLITDILGDAEKSKRSLVARDKGTRMFQQLMSLLDSHTSRTAQGEDGAIIGILNLLSTVIKIDPSQLSEHAIQLTNCLYGECLFAISDRVQGVQCLDKCRTSASRKIAFDMITWTVTNSSAAMRQLMSLIKNIHSDVSKTEWDILPEFKKRHFVGLRNLGSTCYMNSLFQQFFMVPQFVNDLVAVKRDGADPEGCYTLERFQELMLNLALLQHKYCDAVSFVSAFRMYGEPINPSLQTDVHEFFNVLFDELKMNLESSNQPNLLKNYFGVTITQQTVCTECSHQVNREESLYDISIAVQQDILTALQGYIEGELMKGTNAKWCDVCKRKANARRRSLIKTLPRTLILRLERFAYDFKANKGIKLNAYCEFPLTLDMGPFIGDHVENEHQYSLVGVLIHVGTAQRGHYYSLIKERQANRWFKFNDVEISEFNSDDLRGEAFGGQQDVGDASNGTGAQGERSAYLLVYEQVTKTNQVTPVLASGAAGIGPQFLQDAQHRVNLLNLKMVKDWHFYDREYSSFLKNVLTPNSTPDDRNLGTVRFETCIIVLFNVICKSRSRPQLKQWFELAFQLAERNMDGCLWFSEFLNAKDAMRIICVECPNQETRMLASQLIGRCIGLVLKRHDASENESPPAEPEISELSNDDINGGLQRYVNCVLVTLDVARSMQVMNPDAGPEEKKDEKKDWKGLQVVEAVANVVSSKRGPKFASVVVEQGGVNAISKLSSDIRSLPPDIPSRTKALSTLQSLLKTTGCPQP